MIVVICVPCTLAIRIMPMLGARDGVAELALLVGNKSSFWPDKYSCPTCRASMQGFRESDVDPRVLETMTLRDLTAEEAFAAFNGFGLPNEHPRTIAVLQQLLREIPVRRVVGREVEGTTALLIDSLELWDGTRVHFGASAQGAVVYRIVPSNSYAKKVLEELDVHSTNT